MTVAGCVFGLGNESLYGNIKSKGLPSSILIVIGNTDLGRAAEAQQLPSPISSDNSDLSQPVPSASTSSPKGKGKAKELNPSESRQLGKHYHLKQKALDIEQKPKEELLGSYSCPICFSPPSWQRNADAVWSHLLWLLSFYGDQNYDAAMMMAPEGAIAR